MTQLRRAVFLVHLTTGCVVGVVIFFLAATGFMLAWQKPIIAWQERGDRIAPPAAGTSRLPLDQLAAVAAGRQGKPPSSVTVYSAPSAPVEFDFGHNERLLLNPFSGAVLGAGAVKTRAFFDAVTSLHRWFGASQEHHTTARAVKGVFDLALLAMILTGAYLWLPRVWNWRRLRWSMLLRPGLTGKARDWNLHNVLGFWAALPLTVIVLTGAILVYGWATSLLYLAAGSPLPQQAHKVKAAHHHGHSGKDQATLQQILDAAAAHSPGWRSLRIAVPHKEESISVVSDSSDGGRPDLQAEMLFDGRTAALLSVTSFSSLSRGRQLRSFVKYIHTGEAGGLAGETLAGLTSLACCTLVWTGLSMALQRLRATRRATLHPPAPAAEPAQPTEIQAT